MADGQPAVLCDFPRSSQCKRFGIAGFAGLRVVDLEPELFRIDFGVRHIRCVGHDLPAVLGRDADRGYDNLASRTVDDFRRANVNLTVFIDR